MECPSCQFKNPENVKFCGECGAQLVKVCPSCGAKSAPKMKFCGECGQDLKQPAKIVKEEKKPNPRPDTSSTFTRESLGKETRIFTKRDELRVVTILFGDIKGFTPLSQKLAPDEVKEVVDECFSSLEKHIEKEGGMVDKYIGDCVMALFGVPISHEDDPARAVRAAIAMQTEVKNFSDKIKAKLGIPIEMRIGINTGKVLAGHVGKDFADFTVMGEAVNLASRLQKESPLGGVVVSGFTYRHIKDQFLFNNLGEIEIRGMENKVEVYEVLSEKMEEQTLIRELAGLKAPLAGRQRELKQLASVMNQVIQERYPRIMAIYGPHGIGKTRIVYEFTKTCGHQVVTTRCIEHAMSAYSALKGLINHLADIIPADSEERALEKLTKILADGSQARIILRILGLSTEKHEDVPGQVVLKALADLVSKAASTKPLVIVIDDLHYADEGSVVAITYLAMAIEDAPIFLLCAARDEQFTFKDTFCQNLPNFQRLSLIPLEKEDATEMLRMLMPGTELPEKLVDMVIEQSGGNPQYVEEIIRDLMERHIISKNQKGCFEIKDTSDIKVPSTLSGIIQARVDRLPLNERILLQEAAVQGKEFWEEPINLLEKLEDPSTFDGNQTPVPVRLKHLVRKEFVGRKTIPRIPQCAEYSFLHSFTHDVVYESIPGKQKRHFHSIVADWLSSMSERNPQALYGLAAFHYERAGNMNKAAECYVKAAEFSRQSYDLTNAISLYRNTLRLKPKEETIEIRKTLAELLIQTGGFSEATETLKVLEDEGVETSILLGQAEEGKGNYEKAIELYQKAEEETKKLLPSDQSIHLGKIYNGLALIYVRRGENDKAVESANRVLTILENLSPSVFPQVEPLTAVAHNRCGIALQQKGLYNQASEHYKRAHSLYQALGDHTGLGRILNNLGTLRYLEGNQQSAERYYTQALEVAEKTGNLRERSNILNNIGLVSREKSQFENAIKVLTDSVKLRQRMGDKWGIASSLINLALTYADVGSTANAISTMDRAVELELNRNDPNWLWFDNYIRATCFVMQHKSQEAIPIIHKCIELAEEMKSHSQTEWAILLMAEARLEACEHDLALQTLNEVNSMSGDPKEEMKKELLHARIWFEKGDKDKSRTILDAINSNKITQYKDLAIKYYWLKWKVGADTDLSYLSKANEVLESVASTFTQSELKESYISRPDVKQCISHRT